MSVHIGSFKRFLTVNGILSLKYLSYKLISETPEKKHILDQDKNINGMGMYLSGETSVHRMCTVYLTYGTL